MQVKETVLCFAHIKKMNIFLSALHLKKTDHRLLYAIRGLLPLSYRRDLVLFPSL